MNKKRLLLIISIICMLFVLTGCGENNSVQVSEEQLITTTTTFAEVKDDGLFTAFLTYPLAQAINFLEPYVTVAGAIAIVAIALNGLILALTFKSNVAMQRMQEIQPEIEKIQKKYEGRNDSNSQQRMAMEMQQLYQKYDIHPIGSLLTTFIQLPIIFALYSAVRRSAAVANGVFLGTKLSVTPIGSAKLGAVVPITIYGLMILLQIISIKTPQLVAEKRAREEADRKHKHYEKPSNKASQMTLPMVAMIAIIMLNWPVALSLYYCIFSIINVCKTLLIDKLTHKDKVVEEAEVL